MEYGYQYRLGEGVWILFFGGPRRGTVVRQYLEKEKPVYDVCVSDDDALTPLDQALNRSAATCEMCGIAEYKVFPNKLKAVQWIMSRHYGSIHHWLGIAIEDCYRNWENEEYMLERMERFAKLVEDETGLKIS